MPTLLTKDASGTEKDYAITTDPLTIGRSQECNVQLMDTAVSRLHAIVQKTNGKVVITDKSSRGGTTVNGEAIERHELAESDEVQIGNVKITLRFADDEGEKGRAARASRRQKREVLGGARMSKGTQTIVKIVCALVSVMCLFGMAWVMSNWGKHQPVVQKREKKIDQMERPKMLADEARALAKVAREAEHAGDTDKALAGYTEAKEKIEEATLLVEELSRKYSGKGYGWVEELATTLNTQAQGIRQELFKIQMQKMRAESNFK